MASQHNTSTTDGTSGNEPTQVEEPQQWIVRLALDGHTTREIADHLHISEDTVVDRLVHVLKHIIGSTRH